MSALDLAALRRFVELAAERLTGDWVVVGGAVLPLLGGRHRVTADIDIAPPPDAGQDQVNALLEIAIELGLPAEAINQTAAFFLREIPGWRDDLVVLRRGRGATIHTPNATLFVLTKVGRLTESDLDDCVAMLRLARGRGDPVDVPRLRAAIDEQLAGAPTAPRKKRLLALRATVGRRREGSG